MPAATTTGTGAEGEAILCLDCAKSRFPDPREQCYKYGGLICTVDDSNVEKYQTCKFPPGVAQKRK